jgi:hypothetical protein
MVVAQTAPFLPGLSSQARDVKGRLWGRPVLVCGLGTQVSHTVALYGRFHHRAL